LNDRRAQTIECNDGEPAIQIARKALDQAATGSGGGLRTIIMDMTLMLAMFMIQGTGMKQAKSMTE
jgi:hypothetical protein